MGEYIQFWVGGHRGPVVHRALVHIIMCPTNSTTTTMLASTTTTTTLTREKEEEGGKKEKEGRKVGGEKLLDKDWGARIPDYISRSLLSILVFIMGLTMKGDWLLVLALRDRANKESVETS